MAKRFRRVVRDSLERLGICNRCKYWDAIYLHQGKKYPDEGMCRRGYRTADQHPMYIPHEDHVAWLKKKFRIDSTAWRGGFVALADQRPADIKHEIYRWPVHAWNDWCFEFQDWRK